MPTLKTECTELAVAFGVLDRDPLNVNPDELQALFEGTLTAEKFYRFCKEYATSRNSQLYRTLFRLGRAIRSHRLFSKVESVSWRGPEKQASSVSSSQDIVVSGGVPISVKADSNVVYNLSPMNLFERVPQGAAFISRGENWFLKCAPEEFQKLYEVTARILPDLPESAEDFEKSASPEERGNIQNALKGLGAKEKRLFRDRYIEMCYRVAECSAELFDDSFKNTAKSKARSSLRDTIIKTFFRIDSVQYLLAGIDRRTPFAVLVPGITDWGKNWTLRSVTAQPDYNRGQCVVNFQIVCQEKKTKKVISFNFHSEVRWSHGKFCGNPEAKLYKEFSWLDVPFFEKIEMK